jgi:hypothetical protein
MIVYPYLEVFTKWNGIARTWAIARGNLSFCEILATIVEESGGNPNAFNPGDPSFGLMGISDMIGEQYAQAMGDALYDPATNVKAGSGFLSYLKTRYAVKFPLGSSSGWIQCYNEGETNFLRGLRVQNYELIYVTHLHALEAIAAQQGSPQNS